ncbi:MAG: DUF4364 family protein [Clostridia bacterium]|nr:DUF4364 family protein [Clostridia bacterium]
MSMDNDFNAFSDGVEPGGLRNRTQIKILITYVVSKLNDPVKDSMMIEALQIHGLANYFEVIQAVDELLDNGNLSTVDGFLYLTPKGALSVNELSKEIPRSVKETALADVLNLQLLEKREGENIVEVKKAENGYYVTFKVIHKDETLMELTVYAADIEQAETIKHNFLKNPSHVYSTVITSLFV